MPILIIALVLLILAALLGGLCGFLLLIQHSKINKRLNALEKRLTSIEKPADGGAFDVSVQQQPPMPEMVSAKDVAVAQKAGREAGRETGREAGREAFTQKSFDLEAFIAERLFGWIASLALLIGAGFFLKLAYDQQWIGPAARIAIVMASAIAALFYSERLFHEKGTSRERRIIPGIIAATAAASLFLATYFSWYIYGYIPRELAFVIIAWLSMFTVILALHRDSQTLSALGFIGAYLVPGLLSTGQDRGEVLMSYLLLVNLASLQVGRRRTWVSPALISVAMTCVNVLGWYHQYGTPERLNVSLWASLLLILLSLSAPFQNPRAEWRPGKRRQLIFVVGFSVSLFILWDALFEIHPMALGAALCFYSMAVQARIRMYRRCNAATINREAPVLLKLVSAALLVLVAPAVIKGDVLLAALGLAGAASVVIGAFSRERRIVFLGIAVLFSSLLWGLVSGPRHFGMFIPVLNNIFLIWLFFWLTWAISALTLKKTQLSPASLKITSAASYLILFFLLFYETSAWYNGCRLFSPPLDIETIASRAQFFRLLIAGGFPALLIPLFPKLACAHYILMIPHYLAIMSRLHHIVPLLPVLNPIFIAAALTPAGLLLSSYRLYGKMAASDKNTFMAPLSFTIGHVLACVLIAAESYHFIMKLEISDLYGRMWMAGLSITLVAAIYGAMLLWRGMINDVIRLRRLGIIMLSCALMKVFLVDSAGLDQIWRVLSFVVMGAILLVISRQYIRWREK